MDLRTHWIDEAREFTPWLAQEENLALLGETIGLELELEGVEVRVGAFKADILAEEAGTGHYVLTASVVTSFKRLGLNTGTQSLLVARDSVSR